MRQALCQQLREIRHRLLQGAEAADGQSIRDTEALSPLVLTLQEIDSPRRRWVIYAVLFGLSYPEATALTYAASLPVVLVSGVLFYQCIERPIGTLCNRVFAFFAEQKN